MNRSLWVTKQYLLSMVGFFGVILPLVCWAQEATEPPSGGAQTLGVVQGQIIDKFSGNPLVESGVEIKKSGAAAGTGEFTLSDLNGKYSLEIAPGTYEVMVTYPRFQTQLIQEVVVKANEPTVVNIALAPMTVEIEEMKVVAKADRATEEFQLVMRRKAPNIVDNIGAEMITKLPESDAAGLLTRVTGITMQEGKYMHARGMPKRYGRTLLNGAVVPTTRPNEKLVPLDLFPASVIEYMNVSKSFSPDEPGNYAGGLAKITTREFPEQPLASLSQSFTFNAETSFQKWNTYDGGHWDWLAFDDGNRRMPSIIPSDKLIRSSPYSTAGFTPEELEVFGESFNRTWNIEQKSAPINGSFGFVLGDKIKDKFGYVLAFNYSNEYEWENEDQNVWTLGSGGLTLMHELDMERSTNEVQEGGILNMGYEFTPNHKIFLRNFYNRTTEDEVLYYTGFNGDFDTEIIDWRFKYDEEEIYSGQLAGEHYLEKLLKSRIDWRYNYSIANLDQPDLREVLYEYDAFLDAFVIAEEAQSLFHMFSKQREDIHDGALDWSADFNLPYDILLKAKAGGAYLWRDRMFRSRRYRFLPRSTQGIDTTADPESILSPENINPEGYEILETSRRTDNYDADQEVFAGYLMGDCTLFEKWRLTGGFRVEESEINLNGFDPHGATATGVTTTLDGTDWMPSINLSYNLTENINVRLGYSETVSRPEFHELAPFEFNDVRGGRSIKGNPDLVVTEIKNYDFRIEWLPGRGEVLALSLFYKDLTDPIEQTVRPTIQLQNSFINSDDAEVMGIELEARKNLGFLWSRLKNFRFIGNYTFTDSEVTTTPQPGFVPTNLKRTLEGQPDHVANGILEYENPDKALTIRLLYNYTSSRLSQVGAVGLPDFFIEDDHTLDLVILKDFGKLGLKLMATNLTDDPFEETEGGLIHRRYRSGIEVKFGMSYRW